MCFISESCRLGTYLLRSHTEIAFSSDLVKRKNVATSLFVEYFRILSLMWWWYLHNFDSVQRQSLIYILHGASSSKPFSRVHMAHLARKTN